MTAFQYLLNRNWLNFNGCMPQILDNLVMCEVEKGVIIRDVSRMCRLDSTDVKLTIP